MDGKTGFERYKKKATRGRKENIVNKEENVQTQFSLLDVFTSE